MCGIVGYSGKTVCGKPLEVCMQGLKRLEYRGYDSAGVALVAPGMDRVAYAKKAGRLSNLAAYIKRHPLPDALAGIGHTRWATNGEPSDVNAHPHISEDGRIALIHNGIIENAGKLKFDLQSEGYSFVSDTDTEVAAKLLGKIADKIIAETGKPDLFSACRRMARCSRAPSPSSPSMCASRAWWSACAHDSRSSWASARTRRSSAPM